MKIKVTIIYILCLSFLFVACEDYLDKAPESTFTDKDVFGDFRGFQGFVEELYNGIPELDKAASPTGHFNLADEVLNTTPYAFDNGDYWSAATFLYGSMNFGTGQGVISKKIWNNSWYGIAKANMALQKLDEEGLFAGTSAQRDLLKGQALFFRAFYYFQICRFWGGMPYVTRAINPTEEFDSEDFIRTDFRTTALKMAADLREAANILPDHWDNHPDGQATLNHNRDRINKFMCLGYLGQAYLFAASPMINEESTGVDAFDPDLCKQAADVFGELLQLRDNTNLYQLETMENYLNTFLRFGNNRPGGLEDILSPQVYGQGNSRNSFIEFLPPDMGRQIPSNLQTPTHNYSLNFGCKNGYPLGHPKSVYDPTDPWVNRDPRFYVNYAVDNEKFHNMLQGTTNQRLELFTNGYHRKDAPLISITGYMHKKHTGLYPGMTSDDLNTIVTTIPYLRLAEVYLLYAEAVNFQPGGGPKATSSNYSMTAESAINVVRNRATLPDIDEEFTANRDVFFEEIVRERAVELAFEGKRFDDLRRWNRNGDPRYLRKTKIEFDRGPDGKPINMQEVTHIIRRVEKKHNWVPLQISWVSLYKNFYQNPGW